jgi:Uma2 family endonuclease
MEGPNGMSIVSTQPLTADDFFDWCHRPENRDRRFELERGKVVEMSRPGERHGVVCHNVNYLLGAYLRQRHKGRVCANDTGLILERDPDTVRGPDVFLYDQSQPFDQLRSKYSDEVPQLAVEVLSPNDNWGKVLRRVTEFLHRGVAVVWVVDPENRTATVLLPNQLPQVLEENDEITGAPAFPDLRCRVADLFFVPGP